MAPRKPWQALAYAPVPKFPLWGTKPDVLQFSFCLQSLRNSYLINPKSILSQRSTLSVRLLCHIDQLEKTSMDTSRNSKMVMDGVHSEERRNLSASSASPVINKGCVSNVSQAPRWRPQGENISGEYNVGVWTKWSCAEVHLSERQNKYTKMAEAQRECQTSNLIFPVPSFLLQTALWQG